MNAPSGPYFPPGLLARGIPTLFTEILKILLGFPDNEVGLRKKPLMSLLHPVATISGLRRLVE